LCDATGRRLTFPGRSAPLSALHFALSLGQVGRGQEVALALFRIPGRLARGSSDFVGTRLLSGWQRRHGVGLGRYLALRNRRRVLSMSAGW
jgi:hypothetical protein